MSTAKPNVSTPSAEAAALAPMLELIDDVRAGLPRMRQRSSIYLPKYENESSADYRRRINLAPWRPELADSLRTLASRPFEKPVTLGEGAPAAIVKFCDDVDGRGDNLHPFARRFFESAIADGCALLLVDYPKAEGIRTVADEKAAGLRPHWALYRASSIISLRTARIGGRIEIIDARLRECTTEPDGEFGEKEITQVRRLMPGRWEVWRQSEKKPDEWQIVDFGETKSSAPQVGVNAVLMRTGEPIGAWSCRPPLLDLAFAQVELWKALSNLCEVLEYSASPLLVAKNAGLDASAADGVNIGPRCVLQAGADGDWKYISPSADCIREIREHAKDVIADMQRLAMQPSLVRPGMTATEVGLQAAKAHSALEAWALGLKDALQTAMQRTIPFMSTDDRRAVGSWAPVIDVHRDFGSEIGRNEEARIIVDSAKIGLVSKQVARAELIRRGLLSTSAAEETIAGAA
jgi:hypothetical protein